MKKIMKSVVMATTLAAIVLGANSTYAATVQVKKGDTLNRYAKTYGVSVSKIREANQLKNDMIFIGQKLEIPTTKKTNATTVTNTATKPKIATHKVIKGDTLSKIAKKYNISITELKQINKLQSNVIKIGQVLKVTKTTAVTQTVSKAKPVTPKVTSYTVKKGDTLSQIATRYKITVAQLKSWNGLKSNSLKIGQVLKLNASTKTNTTTNTKTISVKPQEGSFDVDVLIDVAKMYIGTPYRWAGNMPSGFDCSGYVQFVMDKVGVKVGRTVSDIWMQGKSIANPEVGDLVFFETYKKGPSHTGIYLGDGTFIHASSSRGVEISSMSNSYWKPRYLGSKSYF